MQLLPATVSKPPREVTTKYGQRLVCDVLLQDGSESAIWAPVGYAPIEYLEQGQVVTVSRDSRGKVSIVENHAIYPDDIPSVPEVPPKTSHTLDGQTKKEIAEYIKQQKDLLQFCWQQAESVQGPQTEDCVEKLAVTLYLSAQRKFKL
jgi:hypothetical protein